MCTPSCGEGCFASRAVYGRFLDELVRNRNLTRQDRFEQERPTLRPLPATPLAPCRELRVSVNRYSTIQVLGNTYSVPSRLIGSTLLIRIRAAELELYHGPAHVLTLPRVVGNRQHRIDYRHLSWSLVRKPGAFAHYRYRDDLFPSLIFRQAYDVLLDRRPAVADREYVRVLQLAASTVEAEVETALGLLLEQQVAPTFDAVRDLVRPAAPTVVPQLTTPDLTLDRYDRLLAGGTR